MQTFLCYVLIHCDLFNTFCKRHQAVARIPRVFPNLILHKCFGHVVFAFKHVSCFFYEIRKTSRCSRLIFQKLGPRGVLVPCMAWWQHQLLPAVCCSLSNFSAPHLSSASLPCAVSNLFTKSSSCYSLARFLLTSSCTCALVMGFSSNLFLAVSRCIIFQLLKSPALLRFVSIVAVSRGCFITASSKSPPAMRGFEHPGMLWLLRRLVVIFRTTFRDRGPQPQKHRLYTAKTHCSSSLRSPG